MTGGTPAHYGHANTCTGGGNMSRVRNLAAVVVAIGTLGLVAGSAPADAAAATSPLLTDADLPDVYTDVADPAFTSTQSPRYPTIDAACVINPSVPFSGLVPDTAFQSFFTDRTGTTGGAETVFTFSDATAAKGLYGFFAKAYAAGTKCSTVKQTIPASASSPARTVDLGKFKTLVVPKVGDERTAVVVDPAVPGNQSRILVFRDGTSVVLLNLRDDDQSKRVFDKLATTAQKRARAAT